MTDEEVGLGGSPTPRPGGGFSDADVGLTGDGGEPGQAGQSDGLNQRHTDEALRKQPATLRLAQKYPGKDTSTAAAVAGSFARNVLPTAAALPAMATGFEWGAGGAALIPGFGETVVGPLAVGAITGLVSGGIAAYGAKKAQDYAVSKISPHGIFSPEVEKMQTEEHPWASLAGSSLSYGMPRPLNVARAAKTLMTAGGWEGIAQATKVGTAAMTPEARAELYNLYNVAQMGGLGGVSEAVDQFRSGKDIKDFDWAKITEATAAGAVFNKPHSFYSGGIPFPERLARGPITIKTDDPEAPLAPLEPAATIQGGPADASAIRRPEEVGVRSERPGVGTEAPLRHPGETTEAQAPEPVSAAAPLAAEAQAAHARGKLDPEFKKRLLKETTESVTEEAGFAVGTPPERQDKREAPDLGPVANMLAAHAKGDFNRAFKIAQGEYNRALKSRQRILDSWKEGMDQGDIKPEQYEAVRRDIESKPLVSPEVKAVMEQRADYLSKAGLTPVIPEQRTLADVNADMLTYLDKNQMVPKKLADERRMLLDQQTAAFAQPQKPLTLELLRPDKADVFPGQSSRVLLPEQKTELKKMQDKVWKGEIPQQAVFDRRDELEPPPDIDAEFQKLPPTAQHQQITHQLQLMDRARPTPAIEQEKARLLDQQDTVRGNLKKLDDLHSEWTGINSRLLRYVRRPNDPQAQALIKRQDEINHEMDALHSKLEGGTIADVGFVGGGPANIAGAASESFEGKHTVVYEGASKTGGASRFTPRIENAPNIPSIGIRGRTRAWGEELRARRHGAVIEKNTEIKSMRYDPQQRTWITKDQNGVEHNQRTLIFGTGIKFTRPEFPGADLVHNGDAEGMWMESKRGAQIVLGGGNSAAQAALASAELGAHVTLISRSPIYPEYAPGVKMSDSLSRQVLAHKNITVLRDQVKSVEGSEGHMKTITTNGGEVLHAKSVGSFLKGVPRSDILPDYVAKDKDGFVLRDSQFRALDKNGNPIPGLYAVGDVTEGENKRIGIAQGHGIDAAANAGKYLEDLRNGGNLPEWKSRALENQQTNAQTTPTTLPRETPTTTSRPTTQQSWQNTTQTGTPVTPRTSPNTGTMGFSTGSPQPTGGISLPSRISSRDEAHLGVETNALIEQVKKSPRVLTAHEHNLLNKREADLQTQQDTLAHQQIAARGSNDQARIVENDLRASEILDKLRDVRGARQAGSEKNAVTLPSGRVSLDKMMRQKQLIEKGRELTPGEQQEVRDAFNDIKTKQEAAENYLATPQAKDYWRQLGERQEAYKKAEAGDRNVKLQPLKFDPRTTALLADAERAKQSWIDDLEKARLAKMTWWQRAPDFLLKWRRAFVISGLHSLAKLGSASLEGTIVLPVREAGGTFLKNMPLISEVAKRAPSEGYGFNIRAEAQAQGQMWRHLIDDFGKNLKGQKPDYEAVWGRVNTLPPELQNYVGYLHGALKSPLARNEFARSLEQRAEFAARHGQDLTDPHVQMELGRQAFQDSQFWRFQNRNMVSKWYNTILGNMERHGGFLGKAAAAGIKWEVPIVVVPTNILARTFEGVFGPEVGGLRIAAAYKHGIENLSPAEADHIMRNLKTGLLGNALVALGIFAPNTFGGFYREGVKKEEGGPGFGQLHIPEGVPFIGGVNVPAWLQDNPFLILPQFGATIRQVGDSFLRKRDTETAGYWLGTLEAVLGAVSESPFVREAGDVTKSMNPRVAADVLGEHLRSAVIPQFVQQIASMTDPEDKRYPTGVAERMKMGIPGMREDVPSTLPPQQQLGIRRRGMTPSRHMMEQQRRSGGRKHY